MQRFLLLISLSLAVAACAGNPTTLPNTAVPTEVSIGQGASPEATAFATDTPQLVAAATSTPEATATAQPFTPTLSASDTPAATPTITGTEIVTATATSTRAPTRTRIPATATRRPQPTATTAPIAFQYSAPTLIEPGAPGARDSRIAGKDDLILIWKPVADLGEKECYLVTVQVINLSDPAQHYGQQSFFVKDTCNSVTTTPKLQFIFYTKKHGRPDYEGLIAEANKAGEGTEYRVRWWVTIVRDEGPDPNNPGVQKTTPLSPASAHFEFELKVP